MTTTWNLDAAHSEILFSVKHLMISNVKGSFTDATATIKSNGNDFSNASVSATIDTASINTKNTDRDNHLRNADFFDADNFAHIQFKGNDFKAIDEENFELTGDLTIKEVTKPITLKVELGGVNTDPWGNVKAGFSFAGKINRKDFGLTWNAALETGGVLVGDDVNITLDVQFVKQA